MIRVGPSLTLARSQQYLNELSRRIQDTQEAAFTGLSVNKPSDAPELWPEIFGVDDSLRDQQQFAENADSAMSLLNVADITLDDAHDTMVEAIETAIVFSSELYTADDRAAAAGSVDAMIESIIDLGNVDVAGRYVFSGTAYDTPSFDANGVYQGSTDQPTTRVGTNNWVTTGFDGGAVFNDSIAALTQLADALRNGTAADVQAALDPLNAAAETVVRTREFVGFEQVDTLDARDVAENLEVTLQERQRNLVSADPFETYTELTNLQTTYQAALQTTSQTLGQSLFNYMR